MNDLHKTAIHAQCLDCLCFIVGNYLHYVEPFYNDEAFSRYKRKLGRNLLVFPVHSLKYLKLEYDFNAYIEFAAEEAKKFDSLTVCVYYADYDSDVTRKFRSLGANIVSAGLHIDPSFARRLKTIISSADGVLTNSIGSHVLFCLGVDIPVKYYSQALQAHSYGTSISNTADVYKWNELLQQALSAEEYMITQAQLDIFEPFIGLSHLKTIKEMGAIFDLNKRLIRSSGYKKSEYIKNLQAIYRELKKGTSEADKLQFRLMREALPLNYEAHLKRHG
jgi:hypothetical protein